MNNFVNSLKKVFRNKNTITILGVIAILVLLYFGYSKQVRTAVNPVRVPVATVTIQPRTKITKDMITTIEVPSIAVTDNVLRYADSIIGKYTAINTVIPSGSMFYRDTTVDEKDLPDSSFYEMEEGQIPYLFSVDLESSFANSILPDSKIDIYMKANDTSGKVMIGKLISDLKVVAVIDSNGNNVFENTAENRTPAYFVFGLDEEIHILFRKATYLGNYGVELIPVPHGKITEDNGETRVSTEYLKEFINANTVMLEGQENLGNKEKTTDNDSSNANNDIEDEFEEEDDGE